MTTRQAALLAMEWTGAVCSMAGALLVAMPTAEQRFVGFLFFAVANVCFIGWALANRHRGVVAMNIFFVVTTLIGLTTNFPR